jgi:hypothetical protein
MTPLDLRSEPSLDHEVVSSPSFEKTERTARTAGFPGLRIRRFPV